VSEAWVYILRCRDDSLYTGWTNDLAKRLAKHSAGKASRYTASRLPVELAFAAPMADRSAAMREEARIKRLSRREKLALLERVASAVVRPPTRQDALDVDCLGFVVELKEYAPIADAQAGPGAAGELA
jgi:putative endonuclease